MAPLMFFTLFLTISVLHFTSATSSISNIPTLFQFQTNSFFFVRLLRFRSQIATKVGGVSDSPGSQNSAEIESLARLAVDQHNTKQNSLLEFTRMVKTREQAVAGTLHHLTIEAVDAGEKKIYEAQVWVKPWLNFKELQEIKHAGGD
ncbi:unnamed protein product [Vicia faba]|uniref:Cysteine proteinase inhibitor n=1 Tax=Vicia faba TaxID=3906 RepID=A0AAV1AAG8_VICFA|nr:unnamed protein product [Vicia faba]CAI8607656.1 unnamed protein product [Vicia faba]